MRARGRQNAERGHGKDEGDAEHRVVNGPRNLRLHAIPAHRLCAIPMTRASRIIVRSDCSQEGCKWPVPNASPSEVSVYGVSGVVQCAAASAIARDLSRPSGCRIPLQANRLKFRWRHREPIMYRRAEVEHQQLGHVRGLGRAVQADDHHGASPYAVIGGVDDFGLDTSSTSPISSGPCPKEIGVERLRRKVDFDDEFDHAQISTLYEIMMYPRCSTLHSGSKNFLSHCTRA